MAKVEQLLVDVLGPLVEVAGPLSLGVLNLLVFMVLDGLDRELLLVL